MPRANGRKTRSSPVTSAMPSGQGCAETQTLRVGLRGVLVGEDDSAAPGGGAGAER